MKNKYLQISLFGMLVLAGTTKTLRASDAGDAIFPLDMDDKARAEIIYQNVNRDLNADDSLVNYDKLEANTIILRMHTDVGQYANLDFDIGSFDPDGGDNNLYGGIGLRYLVYDADKIRLAAFGQVHYAPSVDVSQNAPGIVASQADINYDFLEYEAGLLAAWKLELGNQVLLMPYAGPMLSAVDISGDVKASGAKESLDANENNILGLVAGVGVQLPGQNTIRAEVQYFDSFNVSVGLGFAF